MRHPMCLAVVSAAALLAGLAGCDGRQGDESRRQQGEVFAPAPKRKAVSIPLESIYSTSEQKGLRQLWYDPDLPRGRDRDLRELWRADRLPAWVLLVRGDDIDAAVGATRGALTGGGAAGPGAGDQFWLAAYLGTSCSEPPQWMIVSAEREGRTIRLSFRGPDHDGGTKDIHPYFVWVPLGELAAGAYTLELFDADKKEVTLTRRVTVAAK